MKHMLTFLLTLLMVTSFATVALADPAPNAGATSGEQPPVAICNNATVEADANCAAAASINNGSYDPDGGAVTLLQVPAGPYPLGETLVMLIVTATNGLADTCEATVTVADKTAPVVICPADIVVDNEPGQCGAYVSYDITATDNCSITSPLGKQRASFYPVGVTIITPLVTDASGNEGTCSFKITVKDTERPTIDCPNDIVQGTDPDICGAAVTYAMNASDNCLGVTISSDHPSGTIFPVGVTTVWFKAKDASGNLDSCSFTVTINDTQKPTIACPANIVQSTDPGECDAAVNYDATATDNCDASPVIAFFPPSGSRWPVGTHQVMATATDASGNADTCYFEVQVKDTEAPNVICPDNIVRDNDPGSCGALVGFLVDGYDNCMFSFKDILVTPRSGSFFPIGQTEVTAIGIDRSDNADTCTFLVTVNDTEKPEIDCPIDIVRANDLGQCGATVGFKYFAHDNCPAGLTVVADPPSGSFFNVGATQVTITATDTSKLADTCYFNVTVNDTEKPKITCPANIVEEVAAIDTGKVVTFTVTGTDNCGDPTIVANPPSGSFFYVGTTTVTAVATDPNGLADSCVFTVEVKLALNPDFAVDVVPDTFVTTEGIASAFSYSVFVSSSDGYAGKVVLSASGFPASTSHSFNAQDTVVAPGQALLTGLTSVATPAGNHELTVTGTETGPKAGPHSTTVWLIVEPCAEIPMPVVSQDVFNLQIEQGQNAADEQVFVTNAAACGILNWLAQSDAAWVTPDPTTGSVAAGEIPGSAMTLKFSTSALDTGWSVAHITIGTITKNPPPGGMITINLYVAPVAQTCYAGSVVDTHGNPVSGAIVELYATFPSGAGPVATGISNPDGSYEICTNALVGYVMAYRAGYYPAYDPTQPAPDQTTLTLTPIPGPTPTYEWINLFCDGTALYYGSPAPAGTVIEAFGPGDVLCGQWIVTIPGTFGFMQVYRDDPWTPELDGCLPDSVITLKVNGEPAELQSGATLRWTAFGDSFEACFRVPIPPPPPPRCIKLKQGWNLISWNIDTPVDDIETLAASVMPNVDVILSFEDGALTYDPQLPEFSTLHNTDNAHGYWFKMNADDSLCLSGPLVDPATPINLENNWNLVSYLPTAPLPVPAALTSIWDYTIVVLGYDNGGQTYDVAHPELATLPEMKPRFGYWIKTSCACTMTYPGPVASFANTPADQTRAKSAYVPRVALSNSWVDLYGSNVKLNGQTLPVGSMLEAYSNGLLVGEYTVRENGKFGFMPIYGSDNYSSSNGTDQQITLKVNGQALEQTVTWTANGDRIRVNELTTVDKNSVLMPNVATLNQNYPNPFNPETTIGYTVGKAGHVELSIYNILGARIRTLVSDYQAEGNYSVKWRGDSETGEKVASGVYFYKLITSDQTVIKSMTLLK